MHYYKYAAICSLTLLLACGGDPEDTDDTAGPNDTAESGDTADTAGSNDTSDTAGSTDTADTSGPDENETQLVEGDSLWTYGTDDVIATTTCTNWTFDCADPATTCELDITGADNDSFSAMNSVFSCALTGDNFSCTGTFAQETDAFGNGSAIVLTDTIEPYGDILTDSELNIVLPISLSCEGPACADIDAYMSLPCDIKLDITATLSTD